MYYEIKHYYMLIFEKYFNLKLRNIFDTFFGECFIDFYCVFSYFCYKNYFLKFFLKNIENF